MPILKKNHNILYIVQLCTLWYKRVHTITNMYVTICTIKIKPGLCAVDMWSLHWGGTTYHSKWEQIKTATFTATTPHKSKRNALYTSNEHNDILCVVVIVFWSFCSSLVKESHWNSWNSFIMAQHCKINTLTVPGG